MIPGREPDVTAIHVARAIGSALAELHRALRVLDDAQWRPISPRYDAQAIGSQSFKETFGTIGLTKLVTADLARILANLQDRASQFARLPQQLIHADYDASNVLVDSTGNVTGVLDFEFASIGPRAMDLAIGIWSCGIAHRELRSPWPPARAFLAGYTDRGQLLDEERAALPWLVVLREATSVIHWTARYRSGIGTATALRDRIARLVSLEHWVATHWIM
jgi:Ser/Thr protein kinase RdoA (MazF antagonist)